MALTRIDSYLVDLDSLGGITFDDQAGTPTFRVDATTHRVGIGVNNPGDWDSGANKLVVGSSTDNTGITINTSHSTNCTGTIAFATADASSSGNEKNGAIVYVHNPSIYQFGKMHFSAGRRTSPYPFTISGTGRIGINTNDPQNTFVAASANNQCFEVNPSSTIRINNIDRGNQNTWLPFSIQANDFTLVNSSSTNVLTVASSGNVGIGTTNPQHKLHIYGPSNDGAELLTIEATSVSSTPYTWGSTLIAPQNVGQALLHIVGQGLNQKNSGYFGFVYEGAGSNSNYVTIGGYASDRLLNIKMDGNVGIGTTNPSEKLEVYDGNVIIRNSNSTDSSNDYNSATLTLINTSPSKLVGIDFRPSTSVVVGAVVARIGAYNTSSSGYDGVLTFSTRINSGNVMTEKMRITHDGNVGIGTDNPGDSRLFVNNTFNSTYTTNSYNDDFLVIKNSSTIANTASSIYMIASGDGNSAAVGTINLIHTANGSGDLSFQTRLNSGMNERLRITSSGNVGIGTTDPPGRFFILGPNTYGQSSFVPSGTGALGVSQNQPYGAMAFRNNTDAGNMNYTSWIQSSVGTNTYIDVLIINGGLYRILVKGSANSTVADVAQFMIYGLNQQTNSYPPRIEKVGDSSNNFSTSIISWNINSYDCVVRITCSTPGLNQGVRAFVERIF